MAGYNRENPGVLKVLIIWIVSVLRIETKKPYNLHTLMKFISTKTENLNLDINIKKKSYKCARQNANFVIISEMTQAMRFWRTFISSWDYQFNLKNTPCGGRVEGEKRGIDGGKEVFISVESRLEQCCYINCFQNSGTPPPTFRFVLQKETLLLIKKLLPPSWTTQAYCTKGMKFKEVNESKKTITQQQ